MHLHRVHGSGHAAALDAHHVRGDLAEGGVRAGQLLGMGLDGGEHAVDVHIRHLETHMEAIEEGHEQDLVGTHVAAEHVGVHFHHVQTGGPQGFPLPRRWD
jgi:hypothetical protein